LTGAATQGWTTRALEWQINILYHERLLATSDRPVVEREAIEAIMPLQTVLSQ
jgi:predicted nuclease of restriction endonuclease-like (RecB) superfamily